MAARVLILTVSALALATVLPSVAGELDFSAEIRTTYTDNVYLRSDAESDLVTTVSVWLRDTVHSGKSGRVRLNAEAKMVSWREGSFDAYTYGLVGADYRKRFGKGRQIEFEYSYTTNDSTDFDAPFDLFQGHWLRTAYGFPLSPMWTGEVSYIYLKTNWEHKASDRDGFRHEFRAELSRPVGDKANVTLLGRWCTEKALDSYYEYTRRRVGARIAYYVTGRTAGPRAYLTYLHGSRDYPNRDREDMRNYLSLSFIWPTGPGTRLTLRYTDTNNNSTLDRKTYDEHTYTLAFRKDF